MKDPQQTADELVESIREIMIPLDSRISEPLVIELAILHTQGIIDEINELRETTEGMTYDSLVRKYLHHQQVLTILKTRL